MTANWREIGDVPLETFRAELERVGSPMAPYAEAIWTATRPHSALALAMSWVEQKHATYPSVIPPDYLNPWSQTKPGSSQVDSGNRWMRFGSYQQAAEFWKKRLTSTTGPYKDTVTVEDLIHVYAPSNDGNNEAAYVAAIKAMVGAWPEPGASMAITYGRVPHPGYLDRLIVKPEGQGWNNLGPRQPKFVVLHRMIGSLWGTDGYFRQPGVNALTDYGVGVAATDGADVAGTIIRWNNPTGVRAGWASGPVNGAYGDGLAIVNKYGLNAVNRDGVSIEISGNYDTAVDGKAFEEIAQLMAYWWDWMKIPHTSAPINPATGISAVIWHQEFTLGTGKVCPGKVVMDQTDALIARAKAICKAAQEGTATNTTTPRPGTTPAPQPAPDYPEGLDADLAERWFGKVVVGDAWYTFDPHGSLSRLWLAEGAKTGSYPALTSVETFGTRTYWRFDGGLVIWRPNATAPLRLLKSP
jgi:hypothetical protein